ncbi:transketolase [Agrobacterium sp. YIC 4121]|jgi:transketolase|uniref:transketolase n=1 Tax=Agrobacterium sp. YIC 4121 TaxID=1923829 RepID=UPI0009902480|nr:transketolase [Agrobacterium sp. YIC 4121]OOO25233.1 transketolase [Agrobacterium sp. YIC 4121]
MAQVYSDTDATKEAALANVSLAERAWRIRRNALLMGEVQGQGYVGQALGIADVLAVAWFHTMRYRADDPHWEDRDRFLLSIGHYAIALYAALIEAGIIPEDELETYGCDGSRLPMSGMASYTPGMEITGGSLGHGLGIAVGMALGLKRKNSDRFIINLMSDGELGEGSTWEAAMGASHHRLGNLINLVDFNNQQADGPSREMLSSEPVDAKFAAFGWHVQRVDGNDIDKVREAFDSAMSLADDRPRAIIFDTRMGRGVPFLENREITHFIRVEAHEWKLALDALEEGRPQ